jgi:hypothetical protein
MLVCHTPSVSADATLQASPLCRPCQQGTFLPPRSLPQLRIEAASAWSSALDCRAACFQTEAPPVVSSLRTRGSHRMTSGRRCRQQRRHRGSEGETGTGAHSGLGVRAGPPSVGTATRHRRGRLGGFVPGVSHRKTHSSARQEKGRSGGSAAQAQGGAGAVFAHATAVRLRRQLRPAACLLGCSILH